MIIIHDRTKDGFKPLPFKTLTFSGGEVHVEIPHDLSEVNEVSLTARLDSSDAIMELLLLVDALRAKKNGPLEIHLFMPYVPYARQDRQFPNGAFSLKVFAKLINDLNFHSVMCVDPHSDVVKELINRVTCLEMANGAASIYNMAKKPDYIICPDAGALPKAKKFIQVLEGSGFKFQIPKLVIATKHRDPATGVLSDPSLEDPTIDLNGGSCLIIDDICDGGGTFIQLRDLLKEHGAGDISLYVTHGIFSRGIGCLGMTNVYTTDTMEPFDPKDEYDYRGLKIVRKYFHL